jgi:hypothetical protein
MQKKLNNKNFIWLQEVEDKMVSITEVKSTIALAIAGAFGFIIALISAIATLTAVVITVICVIGILYITKWGGVIKE